MNLSMYEASRPICIHMLKNLSSILEKGEVFAETKNFDTDVLFNSRLAPDMFSLSKQVQIACDIAKGCGARLAGVEVPTFNDDEKTYAELYDRIGKTIAFLDTLTKDQIDGTEEKAITLEIRNTTLKFSGKDYLLYFVIPNLYFHVTTAYNILRHNGVGLGKLDFLGELPEN